MVFSIKVALFRPIDKRRLTRIVFVHRLFRFEDGGWRMEDGWWMVDCGLWIVDCGWWSLESGRWRDESSKIAA
jgi:hypothetical protein